MSRLKFSLLFPISDIIHAATTEAVGGSTTDQDLPFLESP